MLLDLHVHTRRHSPCSVLEPTEAVERARAEQLDGLIITEHGYLWSERELSALRRDSKLPGEFLLLAAQEVETDLGHVLVFGAERSIKDRVALEELRAGWPGAALVWAHPFRDGRHPADAELESPLLDAAEVLNSNQTPSENELAFATWSRIGFAGTGGSDAHAVEKVGMFPTELEGASSLVELVDRIRAGRCRPSIRRERDEGPGVSGAR